eukprot:1322396-Pleurochrysis_carterae.AAC.1
MPPIPRKTACPAPTSHHAPKIASVVCKAHALACPRMSQGSRRAWLGLGIIEHGCARLRMRSTAEKERNDISMHA